MKGTQEKYHHEAPSPNHNLMELDSENICDIALLFLEESRSQLFLMVIEKQIMLFLKDLKNR